jgi:hypothetical protein
VPVTVQKCPSTLTHASSLAQPLSPYVPTLLSGVGIIATMQVGPSATNWNNTQILESVTQVSNTCPTSFPVQCSGSTTFIVGENDDDNNSVDGASTPATQNQFYDNHTTTSASNLLVAGGKDSCSSSCQQTYWCGGQQIGPTFTITRSYTKGTVGPTAVTNIGVSKTP